MRNVWVIARNTFGDALRKRVLLIFLLLAFVMLVLALLLNYFTAREQSTIFKSTQLIIILIFGALIAITTSVFLIPNEIERRTIYSVLAKPIQRWEFFIGKFVGGALTVGFMIGLMSLALMLVLFVLDAKPNQGALEGAQAASEALNVKEWMHRGLADILLVLRGTIVIYFQLVIVTGIATTLSLFLTPTVNFSVTAFIWIVGSLQWLVAALANRNQGGGFSPTALIMKGVYYLVPHFQDFNIMGSIVHPEVPIKVNHWIYAAEVSVYGVAYALLCLIIGVMVFDRKEV